ncbi:arginine/ornithine succinyltransferase subunit [Marinobacter santoriniensis NKSG1]|uniref:Arginine N-succinyltransferase n=1 Tax=Marinobacter santoriniensis NKSG1 TaxID=1288826 RepID=M7CXJ6_9GAMM|nr:arginine N-succinyltransferase [Marinobacter santoriniensis]EMP56940.1 arginine/ornithine succinyltransferase subunit [Marinobacter santoriniensis NKSG1]
MMVVRPIGTEDHEALRELARKTGKGFTSLQDDDTQVARKMESALAAWKDGEIPEEAFYLFAMEDTDTGRVVGICGLEAAVGISEPWYNYHIGSLLHSSRELGVRNLVNTLTLSNDHTGYSELCTLFLAPEARHSKNGSLLSKSRFLFMAEFPQRFNEFMLAEMRGYADKDGISPFWEGLGRQFFSLEFSQADQLSSMDKVFIAELMPKYPIYTNLLPKAAQEVMGETHPDTTPARKLLEAEGMRYTGYVDIFDAGPTLVARMDDIRAINKSRHASVQVSDVELTGELYLVSNTGFLDFRCCMTPLQTLDNGKVGLSPAVIEALKVTEGSTVRIVPLSVGRSN